MGYILGYMRYNPNVLLLMMYVYDLSCYVVRDKVQVGCLYNQHFISAILSSILW